MVFKKYGNINLRYLMIKIINDLKQVNAISSLNYWHNESLTIIASLLCLFIMPYLNKLSTLIVISILEINHLPTYYL